MARGSMKLVTKNGQKRWQFSIHHEGTRTRPFAPVGMTKTQAEKELRRRLNELEGGVDQRKAKKLTFKDYANDRLKVYLKRAKSEDGQSGYRNDVAKLLDPRLMVTKEKSLGELSMDKLTFRIIETVCDDLPILYPKHGNWSIRKSLQKLRSILEDAADDGLVNGRLARKVKLPPAKSKRDREALTVHQLATLWETAKTDWMYYVAIRVGSVTGFRRGELLGLRWASIDWKAERISVRWNYVKGEIKETRKQGNQHTIPVGPELLKVLKEHRLRMGNPGDMAFLFDRGGADQVGVPIDASVFTRRFKELCLLAGIKRPVVLHELRHTAGSLAVQVGGLTFGQQLLGHDDLSTTADTYTHRLSDGSEHASALEELVLEKTGTELVPR